MRDEILSHHEMCGREGLSLQRGMNFHVRPGYSILLMSLRKNAPYEDRWDEERDLLIYEGHDMQKYKGIPDPKSMDQPLALPSGKLTQNGKFLAAAQRAIRGETPAEKVRVYEKLDEGVWSDKGMFDLIDGRMSKRGQRQVLELLLQPIESEDETPKTKVELAHTRLIPTSVKVEVWKRDRGRCVTCGAMDNLHYDHDLPFSKGGSSLTAANVRIMCARHNLQKSDRIE